MLKFTGFLWLKNGRASYIGENAHLGIMKVVITGGTGFIGNCLARNLLGQGHDIRVIARSVPPSDKKNPEEDHHSVIFRPSTSAGGSFLGGLVFPPRPKLGRDLFQLPFGQLSSDPQRGLAVWPAASDAWSTQARQADFSETIRQARNPCPASKTGYLCRPDQGHGGGGRSQGP